MEAKTTETADDGQKPYLHGYDSGMTTKMHAARSADKQAQFFLPYLRPGMRLLDCGCGSGSITVGLAKAVAPGHVIAVDIAQVEVDRARERANQQAVHNVRFEVGDIFQLDFPDDSFDAIFCHNVLEHQDDPLKALLEMKRVLKPGGVLGVRDADNGGDLLQPSNTLLQEWFTAGEAHWRSVRGDPWFGRRLPGIVRQAGFQPTIPTASFDVYGDQEGVHLIADVASSRCHEADYLQSIVGSGLATRERLAEWADAWLAWAEEPDAFFALAHGEVVGWKPEESTPV